MSEIYVKIADLKIKINLIERVGEGAIKTSTRKRLEKELFAYLKVFIVNEKFTRPDFVIDIDSDYKPTDVMYTYNKRTYVLAFKQVSKNRVTTFYQISIYQIRLMLQRVLSALLSQHRGFSIHCSAVLKGASVDFFLGKSGAGKSTISNFLEGNYTKLTDDISYMRKTKTGFYFYEAPEIDKEWQHGKPMKYPIGRFFFIKKANFFKIDKISQDNALKLLTQGESIYDLSKESTACLMEFVAGFDKFYVLYFAKDREKLLELYKDF
jgi:hypothetical protein